MIVELPIKTGRGLNDRVHWAARAKSVKKQRTDTCMLIKSAWWGRDNLGPEAYATRYRVKLTRISAGKLDCDNLCGALKAVRDGVADFLRLDDGSEHIAWIYAQEKCKRGYFGVRVQIEPQG